ncbi:hypothetical protein RB4963 [Rhodopirellula baltica SH 1]|uniref:Uncharacterized protein n=1 Tax=Rhodopirellula baltica (strain DSM 10527 / NCIMB 13988 / SH1) TaxID=243090 RepID=Q7UGX7_RHOBA|nr:hypothetical protein RB4963 [Rhodopirellula baltica SH 1]
MRTAVQASLNQWIADQSASFSLPQACDTSVDFKLIGLRKCSKIAQETSKEGRLSSQTI